MVGDYYTEKERWEQVLAFVRENALPVLAAIAVVAAGYGGLRYWQNLQESHRLAASALYSEVLDAFTRDDVAGGLRLADQLIRDYPHTAYADQAELAAARVQVETNQLPQAERRLRLALDSSRDRELKLVARLRLARVQVAMGHADDAIKTLSGVEPELLRPAMPRRVAMRCWPRAIRPGRCASTRMRAAAVPTPSTVTYCS